MYETKVKIFDFDENFETAINEYLAADTTWQLNYMLHVPDGEAPKIICTFIKIATTATPI
jgi:hypothetical protein